MPTVVRWARRSSGRRGPWHRVVWMHDVAARTVCGVVIPFPDGGRIDTAPWAVDGPLCRRCARVAR